MSRGPSYHPGQGSDEDFAHFRAGQALLRKEERFYPRLLDRISLQGIATDLLILGEHDPVAFTGGADPIDIGRVLREMIVVNFHACTRGPQELRDYALPEAAVNEKDD